MSEVGNISPGCSFMNCHFVLLLCGAVKLKGQFCFCANRKASRSANEHMHKCETHLPIQLYVQK
jgi:hypothetical protein